MPRQALEVILRLPNELPFRVTTTHLEFYSENQRLAQALRLRDIQFEIKANNNVKKVFPQTDPYALAPRPTTSILCGDFNANPHDNVYQSLISQNFDEQSIYVDAWLALNKNTTHAPTCGLFDLFFFTVNCLMSLKKDSLKTHSLLKVIVLAVLGTWFTVKMIKTFKLTKLYF